jgi:hypothetical protein
MGETDVTTIVSDAAAQDVRKKSYSYVVEVLRAMSRTLGDITAEGGFCYISSNAASSRRRLLAGAFASCFSARFATWIVQVMEKFLERSVLASAGLGATLTDC